MTFATTSGAAGIEAALKDFLVLEASGWKGLAGTAIVGDPAIKNFVQSAVLGLAAGGQARIDRLLFNGTAIAATVTLASGDTAWCWKIAYNEGLARSSPGVQLICDLTENLLAGAQPLRVDSCASARHPMIDHVWRERLSLGDRLIGVKSSALSFTFARAVEALRRRAVGAAKAVRDAVRARRSSPHPQDAPDHLAGGGHRHLLDEGDLARILVRR